MADISWWALALGAFVCALLGAGVTRLVAARADSAGQPGISGRWYEERKAAYVALLAAFERTVVRLRVDFAAGVVEPDPMRYLDEVGPVLAQARLLASGPVRSAALAVHVMLEDLHRPRSAPPPGRPPGRHFLEKLAHVPLVLHDLEVAVREELGIDLAPPPGQVPAKGGRSRGRPAAGRDVTGTAGVEHAGP